MMRKIQIILLVISIVGFSACIVFAASPVWDQWKSHVYLGCTDKPTQWDYEHIIAELQQGIKDLKVERDAFLKSEENKMFVSVAALRATADEVFEPFFSKWIAKAQQWDENAQLNNVLENFLDVATEPCPEPRKDKLIEGKR